MGEIKFKPKEIENQYKEIEKEIKKIINEDEDEEKKSAIKYLQEFDVRDEVMKMFCLDCLDLLKKKDSKTEDRKGYLSDYIKMDLYNVVAITALGKKGATKKVEGGYGFDYDYDASIRSTYIYCRTIFEKKETKKETEKETKISKLSPYKYEISCEKCVFHGDTMNSWSKTLNKFFKLYGDGYLNNLNNLGDTEEQTWVEFLSNSENYKKNVTLPSYIIEFMKVVYTMGNFIPVPVGFNPARNSCLEDYWDLTLREIYNYYMPEKKCSPGLKNYAKWLDKYKEENETGQAGWDSFVEENYMQPFVNEIENVEVANYGKPKELWDNHFNGSMMPKEQWQFEQFFVNAKVRILERGKLIATALVNELSKENETQK